MLEKEIAADEEFRAAHLPTLVEVERLKAKYGDRLALVDLVIDGVPMSFVFKPADKKILAASASSGRTDVLLAMEVVLVNTLVWGDKKAFEDVRVFMGVSRSVESFNEPVKTTLKNL